MTPYECGFMNKCAEYGIDHTLAVQMLKEAGPRPEERKQIQRIAQNPTTQRALATPQVTSYTFTPQQWNNSITNYNNSVARQLAIHPSQVNNPQDAYNRARRMVMSRQPGRTEPNWLQRMAIRMATNRNIAGDQRNNQQFLQNRAINTAAQDTRKTQSGLTVAQQTQQNISGLRMNQAQAAREANLQMQLQNDEDERKAFYQKQQQRLAQDEARREQEKQRAIQQEQQWQAEREQQRQQAATAHLGTPPEAKYDSTFESDIPNN